MGGLRRMSMGGLYLAPERPEEVQPHSQSRLEETGVGLLVLLSGDGLSESHLPLLAARE